MSISNEQIQRIAHLARLEINETDMAVYSRNLSNILDLVGQLQAVDTDNIEPMSHPLALSQRLREDAVTETNQRDQFQKIAPQTEAGLYLVPQVIEG